MRSIIHSAVLEAAEHEAVRVHREFLRRLPSPAPASGYRILDWGCGRGSDVLHLRREGWQAFGVEPAADTIERGRKLFESSGLRHDDIIKRLSADNRTDFPAGTFDFLMSYQVLEHVEAIDSAAREMYRLMKPGAVAVHLYPAHRRPVEGHLYMPLVHWFPKNRLRYLAIRLCTQLGIEPHWPEVSGRPAAEKAHTYHRFSCNETFYRSPRNVEAAFRRAGFTTSFEARRHERIQHARLDAVLPADLLEWLLSTFVGCVLVCRKPL